jgi:uncharacterized glyoxalase superfamily protein PhnB
MGNTVLWLFFTRIVAVPLEGRRFTNIFSEYNELKKRNQELRMKVTEMSPSKSEESEQLYQQLKITLDAHNEYLNSTLSLVEKEEAYQLESGNNNSVKLKNAEEDIKTAYDKQLNASAKSRNERKKLQGMLGIEIDKDVDTKLSNEESKTTTSQPKVEPQQKQDSNDAITVTYYYGPDKAVAFTQNNIVLHVGQKLILKRDPNSPESLKSSRFMNSVGGDNFSEVCQIGEMINSTSNQRGASNDGVIIIAKNPGKGKLQVVPNGDWNHAGYFVVTVK